MKRASKTASGTKKVTISLRAADLETMKTIADVRHGGNLSGAFAELIAEASRLEAMDRVIEQLPPPSEEGMAQLEAELSAPLLPPRVKTPKRKRAA